MATDILVFPYYNIESDLGEVQLDHLHDRDDLARCCAETRSSFVVTK